MKRVSYLLLIVLIFIASCQSSGRKVVSSHCEYEEIYPFALTSTPEGFYICPYGRDIDKVVEAEFNFGRVTKRVCGDCSQRISYSIPTVTYPTTGESVLFARAVSGELYIVRVEVTANTMCGLQTYWEDSGLFGIERVKWIPFEDFDYPFLFFTAVQSESNNFYYGGYYHFCKRLNTSVKKYIPVFSESRIDNNDEYGCYSLTSTYGVYCDTSTGSVVVYPGKVDRFYALLWSKGTYRIYILEDSHFMIYDLSVTNGVIEKVFEEDDVKDIFPGLSHIYNKVCSGSSEEYQYDAVFLFTPCYFSFDSFKKFYSDYETFVKEMRKRKYFYLLKTTQETMVEILKPDLTVDYEWYWKPVSGVSYYFMEVTLPVLKREDYLPRGVIFKDGSVYLKDFGREYHFPFRIKKLWMTRYPERIWDGDYSGFMVGSKGYMVLVSDATHFDYVRIRDYKDVKDISWFSIVGKDGSFNSLVFLYQKRFRDVYKAMCSSHNLSCSDLYYCCDLNFSDHCTQGLSLGYQMDISPFLPSTFKWEVDCGVVRPEVLDVGR